MKLVYRTKHGVREDVLTRDEWKGLQFSNGADADSERLRFYAQHCEGKVELSQAELPKFHEQQIIPVEITHKKIPRL